MSSKAIKVLDPATPIADIRLSTGRETVLRVQGPYEGWQTVSDLQNVPEDVFRRLPNFGLKSVRDLMQQLGREVRPEQLTRTNIADHIEGIVRRAVRKELNRKFP